MNHHGTLYAGCTAEWFVESAYGGGNLAGILLAGALPRFKPQAVTLAVHPRSSGVRRVMSLVLFANLGLVPVSQTLSGVLLKISINGVFIGLRIAGVETN